MTQDRTYYRMMNDHELIVIATEHFTTDLELVLLDRLRTLVDVEDRLGEAQEEIAELTARWDRMREEIEEQQRTIAALLGDNR